MFLVYAATAFLAIISTILLHYVALVTGYGPWIAPVWAYCLRIVLAYTGRFCTQEKIHMIIAGGSIGGIIATACAFTLPALWFVDKRWVQTICSHAYIWALLFVLCVCLALVAFCIAYFFDQYLHITRQYDFPVRHMITNGLHTNAQHVFVYIPGIICLCMLWSAGFYICITWLMCVVVGYYTLNSSAARLALLFAFCIKVSVDYITGGLQASVTHALYGYTLGLLCAYLVPTIISCITRAPELWRTVSRGLIPVERNSTRAYGHLIGAALLIGQICLLLNIFIPYGLFDWLYVSGALMCTTYGLVVSMGLCGLAPLGKFATWAMVPYFFTHMHTASKALVVAWCVELVGGIAADLCTHWKIADVHYHRRVHIYYAQLIGILISCCTVVGMYWVYHHQFEMILHPAIAVRAQMRAALVAGFVYDWHFILAGICSGFALRRYTISLSLISILLLLPYSYMLSFTIGSVVQIVIVPAFSILTTIMIYTKAMTKGFLR